MLVRSLLCREEYGRVVPAPGGSGTDQKDACEQDDRSDSPHAPVRSPRGITTPIQSRPMGVGGRERNVAEGQPWNLRPASGYLISGSVPLILIGLVIVLEDTYT